jgi:hypothetical protein
MRLAKPRVDIGLFTNNLDPMLGSVVKINHYVEQLPAAPPSGYRESIVARQDRTEPEHLTDPDGNRVSLLPFGHEGISQIGIRLAVRNLDAHRTFYTQRRCSPPYLSRAAAF